MKIPPLVRMTEQKLESKRSVAKATAAPVVTLSDVREEKVLNRLPDYWKKGNFTDVEITCKDVQKLYYHRHLLIENFDLFLKMGQKIKTTEVHFPRFDSETVNSAFLAVLDAGAVAAQLCPEELCDVLEFCEVYGGRRIMRNIVSEIVKRSPNGQETFLPILFQFDECRVTLARCWLADHKMHLTDDQETALATTAACYLRWRPDAVAIKAMPLVKADAEYIRDLAMKLYVSQFDLDRLLPVATLGSVPDLIAEILRVRLKQNTGEIRRWGQLFTP